MNLYHLKDSETGKYAGLIYATSVTETQDGKLRLFSADGNIIAILTGILIDEIIDADWKVRRSLTNDN